MKPILRYTRAVRRGYPACAPGSSIHRPGQQVYDHVMPSRKVSREKRSLFNLTEIEIQSLWPSTHLHTYIRYVIPTHESAWSRPILLTQSYTYVRTCCTKHPWGGGGRLDQRTCVHRERIHDGSYIQRAGRACRAGHTREAKRAKRVQREVTTRKRGEREREMHRSWIHRVGVKSGPSGDGGGSHRCSRWWRWRRMVAGRGGFTGVGVSLSHGRKRKSEGDRWLECNGDEG